MELEKFFLKYGVIEEVTDVVNTFLIPNSAIQTELGEHWGDIDAMNPVEGDLMDSDTENSTSTFYIVDYDSKKKLMCFIDDETRKAQLISNGFDSINELLQFVQDF